MDNIQVNSGSGNGKSKQQNRTKRELILPWYFWLYKSLRPVQCFADHRGQLQDVPPRDILFPVGPSHCSGQVSSNDQNKKLFSLCRVQIKMWAVVRIQRCFKRFLKRKAQQKESKKKVLMIKALASTILNKHLLNLFSARGHEGALEEAHRGRRLRSFSALSFFAQ